jgi:hypothetical protein
MHAIPPVEARRSSSERPLTPGKDTVTIAKRLSGQTPDQGLTGFTFSISVHSAGISWLQPAEPAVAEARVAAAAPDGRFEVLAAAAGPDEAVAALASLLAAPDAAVVQLVAVAQLAAAARRVERAAVLGAWKAPQRV